MQKILITTGLLLLLIGILWPYLSKLPIGRLPGDIFINKPNMKIYIPFMTMLILSLLISLIIKLFKK